MVASKFTNTLLDRIHTLEAENATLRQKLFFPFGENYEAVITEVTQCFDDCQGLEAYGHQESDRYWEMADKLMHAVAAGTGRKMRRKLLTR